MEGVGRTSQPDVEGEGFVIVPAAREAAQVEAPSNAASSSRATGAAEAGRVRDATCELTEEDVEATVAVPLDAAKVGWCKLKPFTKRVESA